MPKQPEKKAPTCPKCGYHPSSSDDPFFTAYNGLGECPKCGIIVAKYLADKERAVTDTSAEPVAEAQGKPGQSNLETVGTQLNKFQRISNYRILRRTLRPAGIGSIVFGLIAIYMGFGGMETSSVNMILGVIGIFLLVEGIWVEIAPTPNGMFVEGIAFLLIGAWNIFVVFANMKAGYGNISRFALILGIWQIMWGFRFFGGNTRLSEQPADKPSNQALKIVDDIVKELTKANPEGTSDVIKFRIKNKLWKGRLARNFGVFVEKGGRDVTFSRKDRVRIQLQDKAQMDKKAMASFIFGDRNLKGMIDLENFERYKAWKAAG